VYVPFPTFGEKRRGREREQKMADFKARELKASEAHSSILRLGSRIWMLMCDGTAQGSDHLPASHSRTRLARPRVLIKRDIFMTEVW